MNETQYFIFYSFFQIIWYSPEERIEIIAEWLQEQTPNIEMPMETDKW